MNVYAAGLLPDGDTVYVPFQDGLIAAYDRNWRLLRTIRVSQSVYRMRMDAPWIRCKENTTV